MNKVFPLIPLLGIVTVITLPAKPLLALESSVIAAKTQEFTVQISGEQTGTGTIIENEGDTYRILTCWHVVDDSGQYNIVTPDGKTHEATQTYNLPGDVDLAIIEFNSKDSYQVAEFGDVEKTNPGNNLYTAGYPDPFPGFPERSYAFLNVAIISKQSKGTSGYQMIYSNPTPPGGSGGGIFDSEARLIGVNGRVISEGNTFNSYGAGIPLQVYLASRDNLVISTGQKKLRAKDYDGAIAELDRVIASNPDLVEAYIGRAAVYYQVGNFSDAIKDLNLVLKKNSDNAKAYSYRGLTYSSLGEHEKAFEDHDRAISLNPDLDIVYANRGLSYMERNKVSLEEDEEDVEKAILDLAEAIRINPDYASENTGQNNILWLARELKQVPVTNVIEAQLEGIIPIIEETENFLPSLLDGITSSSIPQEQQIETLLALGEAFHSMELFRVSSRFLKISLSLTESLQSSSEQKFDILMSLGKTAEAIHNERRTLVPSQEVVFDVIANSGGSAEFALSSARAVIDYYEQAAKNTTSKSNIAQAQLAQLNILIDSKLFWQQATTEFDNNVDLLEISDPDFLAQIKDGSTRLQRELSNELEPEIAQLTQEIAQLTQGLQSEINDASIYLLIDLASNLIKIDRYDSKTIEILNTAISKAKQLNNREAEVEAISNLAYLHEQKKEYAEAKQLTKKGLKVLERNSQEKYPKISSILHNQQARLLAVEGKIEAVIAAYENSLADIQTFSDEFESNDLESIESIVSDYINFLLSSNPSETQLQRTLEILEFTKTKRIKENFNIAVRQKENLISITQAYPNTAVVYPILRENSLDLILSLPEQPLRHYSTKNIKKAKIENTVKWLRRRFLTNPGFAEAIGKEQGNPQAIAAIQKSQNQSLEKDIIPLASELYSLLIQPAEAEITATEIKNLVFVVDGFFQNISMSSLYDANSGKYLIEKYNIAYSRNSQITNPQLAQNKQISVLGAGTTREFPAYRFPSIPGVENELKQIKQTLPNSTILLNDSFTIESLEQKLQESDYSAVHLATHGQFAFNSDSTFFLSGKEVGNPLIHFNQFVNLFQNVNLERSTPIELLVLSAADTAQGDPQTLNGLAAISTNSDISNTLGTLWGANDTAMVLLMKEFYGNLAANSDISKFEALRNAQLTLLNDSKAQYRHPYYWAAPILLID